MKRLMFCLILGILLFGISFVSAVCTDTDGGWNYTIRGTTTGFTASNQPYEQTDRCSGDYIAEYACDGEEVVGRSSQKCNEIIAGTYCLDGACVSGGTTCVDGDNGNDFYVRSNLTVNGVVYLDYCEGNALQEANCDYTDYYNHYQCPNGCRDGACTEENTTISNVSCTRDSQCDSSSERYCSNDSRECTRTTSYRCTGGECVESGGGGGCSAPCPNGCLEGMCIVAGDSGGMNECLDNPNNYWDQETDRCYQGYSGGAILNLCLDLDGGSNYYKRAHTFGFRSYSTADDSDRDLRIRTGGKDYCDIETGQMLEYYCDENGYIRTIYFDCPRGCADDGACVIGSGEEVSEQVKCVFDGSKEEQECYLAGSFSEEDEGVKYCRGKETCVIDVLGYEGEKITWKSSCGGYDYTILDGENEYVDFNCEGGEIDDDEEIEKIGFFASYWECYDGESMNDISEMCFPGEVWQMRAEEFCDGHCYDDQSKCGVNSFSVSDDCYLDDSAPDCSMLNCPNAYYDSFWGGCRCADIDDENIFEPEIVCRDSCPRNGKCYQFGHRKSEDFCSDEGMFVDQRGSGEVCENSFECKSNVCVDGECVKAGLFKKFVNWFRNIFGG